MKQDRYLDRDFLTNWKISKVPEILGPSGAIHLVDGPRGQLFGPSVTSITMVWLINHSDPHQHHQRWWPSSPWPCPPSWCCWPPWSHPPHRCYPFPCCCPPPWCWSTEEWQCGQIYASSQRGQIDEGGGLTGSPPDHQQVGWGTWLGGGLLFLRTDQTTNQQTRWFLDEGFWHFEECFLFQVLVSPSLRTQSEPLEFQHADNGQSLESDGVCEVM